MCSQASHGQFIEVISQLSICTHLTSHSSAACHLDIVSEAHTSSSEILLGCMATIVSHKVGNLHLRNIKVLLV